MATSEPTPETQVQNAINELAKAKNDERVSDERAEQIEQHREALEEIWHEMFTSGEGGR